MIKNIIFDIGGVLAEEVSGRALTYLSAAEQQRITDLVYSKNPEFTEVLLGNESTAYYSSKMCAKYPELEKEISFLLNPANLSITYPIKQQTLDLLHELRHTYKIYFLSDMIDSSYDYLKDILQDFDGGVYSFQEHHKKPDPTFFKILLNRYNINPTETFFFDDKEKNIIAAQKLNMKAAVFINADTVRRALRQGSSAQWYNKLISKQNRKLWS